MPQCSILRSYRFRYLPMRAKKRRCVVLACLCASDIVYTCLVAGLDKLICPSAGQFLAFPPDGEFELWLLAEREDGAGPKPEFMADSSRNELETAKALNSNDDGLSSVVA